MRNRLLLLSGMLMACCATAQEYTPPPGVPQATLVFKREKNPMAVMVLIFFTEAKNCTGKVGLPGRGRPFWEGEPLALEAGREFAFAFRDVKGQFVAPGIGKSTRCDLFVSFTPQPNAKYRLTYDRTDDNKECSLVLTRLEGSGDTTREVAEPTFRKREPLYASDSNAPLCKPYASDNSGGSAPDSPSSSAPPK